MDAVSADKGHKAAIESAHEEIFPTEYPCRPMHPNDNGATKNENHPHASLRIMDYAVSSHASDRNAGIDLKLDCKNLRPRPADSNADPDLRSRGGSAVK